MPVPVGAARRLLAEPSVWYVRVRLVEAIGSFEWVTFAKCDFLRKATAMRTALLECDDTYAEVEIITKYRMRRRDGLAGVRRAEVEADSWVHFEQAEIRKRAKRIEHVTDKGASTFRTYEKGKYHLQFIMALRDFEDARKELEAALLSSPMNNEEAASRMSCSEQVVKRIRESKELRIRYN